MSTQEEKYCAQFREILYNDLKPKLFDALKITFESFRKELEKIDADNKTVAIFCNSLMIRKCSCKTCKNCRGCSRCGTCLYCSKCEPCPGCFKKFRVRSRPAPSLGMKCRFCNACYSRSTDDYTRRKKCSRRDCLKCRRCLRKYPACNKCVTCLKCRTCPKCKDCRECKFCYVCSLKPRFNANHFEEWKTSDNDGWWIIARNFIWNPSPKLPFEGNCAKY